MSYAVYAKEPPRAMPRPKDMAPLQAIARLRNPWYAMGTTFLVYEWPDGALTCVMTASQDEISFRRAIGFEPVTRETFIITIERIVERLTGQPYRVVAASNKKVK